jgi:hypothetical protein
VAEARSTLGRADDQHRQAARAHLATAEARARAADLALSKVGAAYERSRILAHRGKSEAEQLAGRSASEAREIIREIERYDR